jgi:hypothetical protein
MRDLKTKCAIDRTTELEVEYSQIKNVAIFYAASNDAQLTSVAMDKLQVEALIEWLGEALAVMERAK